VMGDAAKVVSNPEFIRRHLTQRSLVPALSKSPEEFAELIKRDRAVAERVVKDAGLEPQ